MRRRHVRSPENPLLLLITAAILITWTLYRFALFLSVHYNCVSLSEIWFEAAGTRWPLFGAFAFVFFLLFVWNLSFLGNPGVRSRYTDLAIVALSSVAVLAVGAALAAQVRASSIRFYYEDAGVPWNVSESVYRTDNTCELAAQYVGAWKVLAREKPTYAQNFPVDWVEFHRDLSFEAGDSAMSARGSGNWSPVSWKRLIWMSSDMWGDSIWEPSFSEDGDLRFTTPSFEPDAVTTIVLRRIQ